MSKVKGYIEKGQIPNYKKVPFMSGYRAVPESDIDTWTSEIRDLKTFRKEKARYDEVAQEVMPKYEKMVELTNDLETRLQIHEMDKKAFEKTKKDFDGLVNDRAKEKAKELFETYGRPILCSADVTKLSKDYMNTVNQVTEDYER